MKALRTLLIALFCTTLIACNKGQQINGHNMRTAFRSVKTLKERMAPEPRIEFEVSFWTIRDAKKSDEEFLDAIDGKTPTEIIALGQEIYQQRKNSGYPGYEKYTSWEDMISKYSQERSEQNIKQGENKEGAKDKANDVLYNLR
ncbi:MAG: hypothetical protein ACXWTH_07590 [Methylosarcina sp.]